MINLLLSYIEDIGLRAFDHLKHLVLSIGPRGATTENERRAAMYIERILRASGLAVWTQEFPSIPSPSYSYILIYTLCIIGTFLCFLDFVMGAVIVITAYTFYVLENIFLLPIVTQLLSFIFGYRSKNVIGLLKSDEVPRIRVVLIAHYDTAKASSIFKPEKIKNIKSIVRTCFTSFTLIVVLSIINIFIESYALSMLIVFAGIPIYIELHGLIESELKHNYVVGANDNASGVAVLLALAEYLGRSKPMDSEIWFIATGAKEVNTLGITNFVEKYRDILNSAYIINFDSLGKGELHYVLCEGILKKYCLKQRALKEVADKVGREIGIRPREHQLLLTDSSILLKNDYEALTLMGLSEYNLPMDYHWYTDTLIGIKISNLRKAIEFTIAVIDELRGINKSKILN